MTSTTKSPYAGYRFPGEVISHAVWLYFRFPLSLRMVEEMLAARGIDVSHETVRQWARKFGQDFANQIRRRLPCPGDKWHLDEVCLMIRGTKHWLWRAVDQDGVVLDVLVQSRRDKRAAKRLLRKLLKKQGRAPRVMVTDKLASYGAAKGEVMPSVEHRRHKGLVWGHRCQGSSSAAAFLRVCWAERRLRANPRGVRHRALVIAPQPCIRWASWGPNHDAAMRISGEAPGRRVQSEQRLSGHSLVRRTATSDHPRQLTTGTPMSAEASRPGPLGPVAHDAGRRTTPSGASPVVTKRHKAIKSFRARATIMVLRVPPRASAVRARYHCARALSFWNSRKRQASCTMPRRTRALPALARPFSRRLAPLSSGEPVRPA